uniref:Cytochrome P450 2K1-like n=1 Tax=Tetraodon nigroviridis TaxID=99883 RepID=H3C9Z9_TETNG
MGIFEFFLQSSTSVSLLGALLLLLLYLSSSVTFSSDEDRKCPPGPKPLPILGNLLQLDLRRPYNSLMELSRKHGSVFTVYLGRRKVVVLAGYKTVKEALVNHAEEFGDRAPTMLVQHDHHQHGVLWANGDSWKEMRRFALASLRDFRMGRKVCEDKIFQECSYLMEVLKEWEGEPFDTTQPINFAVSNIICSMVYGSRFDYDDPEFTSLVDRTITIIQLAGSPSIMVYNNFPWIGALVNNRRLYKQLISARKEQNSRLFAGAKKTMDPQTCRGFVDAFLIRQQSLEESGVTKSHFHQDNLLYTIMNLFAAGTDTTAITLRWGLLLMAKHPQIQNQVQEELSRVVGHRQVLLEDRKNLHFTNAVVHEIQRVANVAPTALPHVTSQDVVFQGHFIKKGTVVYPLLAAVLCDEEEWEQPHTFHPAHFLDQEAKFVKPDAFMPFSAGSSGPRACPGEALARMELFIFLASLLQHFSFSPVPGVSPEQLLVASAPGSASIPLAHQLCALPRL